MKKNVRNSLESRGLISLISGLLLVFLLVAQLAPYKDVILNATFSKGPLEASQIWLREINGSKANVVVVGSLEMETLSPVWNYVAQGGEGDMLLDKALEKGKLLKPHYVRIDHVFDQYDVVSLRERKPVMNFEKLDKAVDLLTRMGAKPFFSLSYMPPEISKDGSILGEPVYWGEWQAIVTSFVEHYSGSLGIEDVYYEVWNEPDLFGNWKLNASTKNYLVLYEQTAIAAQRANVKARFYLGGPATTGLYPNWVNSLVEHALNNQLQLDFISWHRYSPAVNDYIKDIAWIRDWKSQHPSIELDFILSEWGMHAEMNPHYDTYVSAAHLVAVAREAQPVIQQMYSFELIDGISPEGKLLWGRWGMLDSTGRPKPRFVAHQLLNKLAGNRLLVLGEGYWVRAIATQLEDTYQILVVNYDDLEIHQETFSLTLTNIPDGFYRVSYQFLDGRNIRKNIRVSGNEWKEQLDLNPNDVLLLIVDFQK